MARTKLFETAVATNTRLLLYWDFAPASGFTGWFIELVAADDAVVNSFGLTNGNLDDLKSLFLSDNNGVVCLAGGYNSEDDGADTVWAAYTRDNKSSWPVEVNVDPPEYVELTAAETSILHAWFVCGHGEPAA